MAIHRQTRTVRRGPVKVTVTVTTKTPAPRVPVKRIPR